MSFEEPHGHGAARPDLTWWAMHREQQARTEPEILLTTAEMSAVDLAAVASGISIDQLMETAGRAVADAASGKQQVAILCGPGNNGGDGYAAARLLSASSRQVTVFANANPASGSAAARQAASWSRPIQPLDSFEPDSDLLVIDALYGAGLNRPIAGAEAEVIRRLNASNAMTLAVDVPSGLNGDTGMTFGPVVEANQTITFFSAKPGHWLWPGRSYCGDVTIADIGLTTSHIAASGLSPSLFRNEASLWRHAMHRADTNAHKYQRGHCLVVSGDQLRTGASRLVARAAQNAGAGAVTIVGNKDALRVHAAHLTAIMLREAESLSDFRTALSEMRIDAAVIGPAAGIGEATRHRLGALLDRRIPTVIDADALTSLINHLDLLRKRPMSAPIVLTPHEGEFNRLFGNEIHVGCTRSKVERARAAARLANAVVIYKGVDTVIAAEDGRAAINTNGGPELATAGSGDVLSGMIAAHLAQGMPAFEAAAAAVQLHAFWGAKFGTGLTADRLIDLILPLEAMLGL
jgi:ADP-dependent NAD(P)H-hydrate dehydratase / NAD(P)H-hydrate epimerase